MSASNLNQTIKIVRLTFGVMSAVCLISFGWKAYEQSQREAELRQLCNNLNQFTSSVQQQRDQASRIELMGGLYTQSLYNANCRNIGR